MMQVGRIHITNRNVITANIIEKTLARCICKAAWELRTWNLIFPVVWDTNPNPLLRALKYTPSRLVTAISKWSLSFVKFGITGWRSTQGMVQHTTWRCWQYTMKVGIRLSIITRLNTNQASDVLNVGSSLPKRIDTIIRKLNWVLSTLIIIQVNHLKLMKTRNFLDGMYWRVCLMWNLFCCTCQ